MDSEQSNAETRAIRRSIAGPMFAEELWQCSIEQHFSWSKRNPCWNLVLLKCRWDRPTYWWDRVQTAQWPDCKDAFFLRRDDLRIQDESESRGISNIFQNQRPGKNYFTSSDPHHDMLGGGCQVRVVIENMMGRMENLRTLISGFLGLVILVRWALVTMFLSWTTQTGCRIHRTYVSLIGSGEGRHTTHLLKCVPLLSTSQTDWKQSSDVLSDISFDILSDISSDIFFWHIFWHSFWHIFWHSFWHLSDISSDLFFWHIFWPERMSEDMSEE